MEDKFPKDKGCPLHPSCLTCPEPICAYEYPGGFQAYLKKKADGELFSKSSTISEVAESLGIHKRTAERRFYRTFAKVG